MFARINNKGNKKSILIDLVHSKSANPEIDMDKININYAHNHGYSRLIEFLKENNIKIEYLRKGNISETALIDKNLLFINLVDEKNPKIAAEEISAIKKFVENGGSLLVICEHTNVNNHAEIINHLLKEFNISVRYGSSLDSGTENIVEGVGWTRIHSFIAHPITKGIKSISFQTGGALYPKEYSIAFSSPSAFLDNWNPYSNDNAFYGNGLLDRDEKKEILNLAVAREYGKGKIVVVADQNIFGNYWIYYLDNFIFAKNIFSWLLNETYSFEYPNKKLVGMYEPLNSARIIGNTNPEGYYSFYGNLNRDSNVSAFGIEDESKLRDMEVVIIINPGSNIKDKEYPGNLLAENKTIVEIFAETDNMITINNGTFKGSLSYNLSNISLINLENKEKTDNSILFIETNNRNISIIDEYNFSSGKIIKVYDGHILSNKHLGDENGNSITYAQNSLELQEIGRLIEWNLLDYIKK